ncbi:hypothetical protein GCM10025871_00730 [Deinococcus metallilatus]|nr:hypothetical protein GCM10025871_00730 [Deinococcus metallilatus]
MRREKGLLLTAESRYILLVNTITTRRTGKEDIPALIPLILVAARTRAELEPALWPLHPEAENRVRSRLEGEFSSPERFAWFLAEQNGEAVGVISAGLYPAPPVYRSLLAGLIGEDFYADTPGALPLLLSAAESFLRAAEAALINAACPARDKERLRLLQAHGYAPLTLWMARPVDPSVPAPASIRPAREDDLPALVRLNRDAQEGKRRANPRFWTPHPEASARFEDWMRHSLTLPDRDLLVHEGPSGVDGFVVAQPAGSPPAHNAEGVGLIDDLYADAWNIFPALLNAAHHAFHKRGKHTVEVICPAAWTERAAALEDAGFRPANLWLIQD